MTTTSDRIADFTHLQARPNLIFARPGPRPGTGRTIGEVAPLRLADLPGTPLCIDRHQALARLPYPDRSPLGPDALAALMAAAGFQRYEPSNNYNAHRGYPSAQCLFPVEVFLCSDQGSWLLDASRHELRPTMGTAGTADPSVATTLAVLGRPGKLPTYYRELQWALTLCEAGHLTELLLSVAAALGFAPRLRLDFDDAALLQRIGAEPDDPWLPAALVELGSADLTLTGTERARVEPADPVLAIDQLGWGHPLGTAEIRSEVGPGIEISLAEPSRSSSTSWADVLFERSSGRGTGGFAAAPDRLPGSTLANAMQQLRTAARQRWYQPSGSRAGQRVLAVVERVDGLADGLYEWPLLEGPGRLRRAGRFLTGVQQAFFYPETVTRVDTCNIVLLQVLDYAAIAAARGVRGLRASQLELGALAQAAGLSMAADGAFLRPCRSFDADRLAVLAELSETETVSYLCLGGTSRFTDLLLDLRP